MGTDRATAIPFNRPYATGAEFDYIREAIANSHVSGNGPFTRRCAERLERELGSGRVLLTHSCTGALEMAVLLADVGPGRRGDRPVVRVRVARRTRSRSAAASPSSSTSAPTRSTSTSASSRTRSPTRTRALAPIDYAGVGCEMDAFSALARDHGLVVIEDAAQGYGASYRGRPLGTLADARLHQLPRDEERDVRRRRRASRQPPRVGRARRGDPGEGHEPQQVLPRPGGQVHLGRPRFLVRRQRHQRGVPLGAARAGARDHGEATRDLGRVPRGARGPRGGGPAPPSCRPRSLRRTTRTCTTCCWAGTATASGSSSAWPKQA